MSCTRAFIPGPALGRHLSALSIAIVAFVVIIAAAWFGAYLRSVLPEHHLTPETESAVRIGVGLIATMAALVLGFLLASAKGSFDTKSEEIRSSAAKLILLDRNLRQYGVEADPIRAQLRATAKASWITSGSIQRPHGDRTFARQRICWRSNRCRR